MNDNSFDLNQYQLLNEIGKGSFGVVYRVKCKKTGKIYAAKISQIDNNSFSEEELNNFIREVNIMGKVNHPSIIQYIGFSLFDFDGNPNSVIVTELMNKGSLTNIMKLERSSLSDAKWNDTQKLITIYGIASAMSFLHSNNILHRDLKPDNILMDDDLYPKIADFGLSKVIHQNAESITFESISGYKGTPLYSAPEVLFKSNYSTAGDVYSFSLIAYEILTGEKPYGEAFFKKIHDGTRPEFKCPIISAYRNLIERCWSEDPSARPTFDDIVQDLQSNQDYITDLINEDEFYNYVDYIKECQKGFSKIGKVVNIQEFKLQKRNELKEIKKPRSKREKKFQKFFTEKLKKILVEKVREFTSLPFNDEMLDEILNNSLMTAGEKYVEDCQIDYDSFIAENIYTEEKLFCHYFKLEHRYDDDIHFTRTTNFIIKNIIFYHLYHHPTLLKFIGYDFGKLLDDYEEEEEDLEEEDLEEEDEEGISILVFYEFVNPKSLDDYLTESRKNPKSAFTLTPLQRQMTIIGITAAILYLHQNGILFERLNPSMIFFDENFYPKIAYTYTIYKNNSYGEMDKDDKIYGFQDYFAPEYLRRSYDFKLSFGMNIYTLAMFIYTLIAGKYPYLEQRRRERIYQKIYERIVDDNLRPQFTEDFSKPIRNLLESSWDSIPFRRGNIMQIFNTLTSSNEYFIDGLTEPDINEISKYIQMLKDFGELIHPSLDISHSIFIEKSGINDDLKALTKEGAKLRVKASENPPPNISYSVLTLKKKLNISYSITFEVKLQINLTLDQICAFIDNNDFTVYKKEIVMYSLVKLVNDKIIFQNSRSMHNVFSFVNDLVAENNEDAIKFLKIKFGDYIVNPEVKILTEKICNKMITKANIPPTVTIIGKSSFAGFANLEFVNIPNSVVEIEENAFCDCPSLTFVNLPESVRIIGRAAFHNCPKLIFIQIPSKVTEIQQETFKNDVSLSDVVLGNSLKYIEKHSFYGCEALVSIHIPKSVVLIQDKAFYNCSRLKKIVFEGEKPKIGKKAIAFTVITKRLK